MAAKKSAPEKKSATPAKKTTTAAGVKKAATSASPAKKAAAAKKPAKQEPAKKAASKEPAKKPAAKKSAAPEPAKKPAAKKAVAPEPAKKAAAPAKTAADKKAAVVAPPAPVARPVQVINPIGGVLPSVRKAVPGKKAAPKHPVVQEDESTWSKPELTAVRKVLDKEAAELTEEIEIAELKFQSLIMESGEGAGDDQADAGTKTFEREHEISILSNKRDLLDQTQHALARIDAGTYGRCENCGRQIGKLRLQEANPRATLCMPCREREDRS